MKKRLMGSIFWVVVLAFSGVVLAQTAGAQAIPRTADGKPDLSGVWKTVSSEIDPLQLTDWGTARYNYNKRLDRDLVRPELDPINHCYRPGLARIGPPLQVPSTSIRVRFEDESVLPPGKSVADYDAIEIRYAARKVWMIYQYNHEVRQIFMDGRDHPEDFVEDPFTRWWNGHSTGSWDGDTFVVDTTNIRNETLLDNQGHEHKKLHVVERIRRVDANTLEIERTLTDPDAFTTPHKTRATLKLMPNMAFQENVICDQYYVRKVGFGFGGLLGINDHPWQSPEEDPNATWGEGGVPIVNRGLDNRR